VDGMGLYMCVDPYYRYIIRISIYDPIGDRETAESLKNALNGGIPFLFALIVISLMAEIITQMNQ
jgi:hypothetical protein